MTAAGAVLVVDDDVLVRDVVGRYLSRAGYQVTVAGDGEHALRAAQASPPDLVVLDLMLPGLSGLEVCRRLRAVGAVPVVMLTALGEEEDRIVGLELGADDYITKPFSPRELVLRVASVLRRARSVQPRSQMPPIDDDGLMVDVAGHRAELGGQELALTVREFELLAFLVQHPGRAFTRSELLEQVWGWTFATSPPSLSTCDGCGRRWRSIPPRRGGSPPCGVWVTATTAPPAEPAIRQGSDRGA